MRQTTESRRYEIRPDAVADWIIVFTERIVPLRESAGFTVLHPWVDLRSNEFGWLFRYPGDEEEYARAERRYDGLPEHEAIHELAGPWITGTRIQFVEPLEA